MKVMLVMAVAASLVSLLAAPAQAAARPLAYHTDHQAELYLEHDDVGHVEIAGAFDYAGPGGDEFAGVQCSWSSLSAWSQSS